MALSKTDKMRLFQKITDWSTDKMRANKKAIHDIICDGCGENDGDGDDSSDSQDCITLEDFSTFYISVIDDDYATSREVDETLELSDFFETSNINLLKGLLTLGANAETNSDPSQYFYEYKNDPNHEEGWYSHSIIIYPNGSESGHIQISTTHTFVDDGVEISQNYDIAFDYNGEDTLTVLYVNSYGE